MFEEIELHNFQCHKSLKLPLARITTLVGVSDSGKTAVLRALDWVCYNRGKTALLLKRGATDVSVTLTVDGHSVTRTSKENAYYIDGSAYTTIGRTMPPELGPLLRMGEDNVQRQHDGLFWFTASGAALVSNLNRVVDLSKLEEWVKSGVGRERHIKERVGYFSERKSELETQRNELILYRLAESELVHLEALFGGINDRKSRFGKLQQLAGDFENLVVEIACKTNHMTALKEFISQCEALVCATKLMSSLTDLICEHRKFTERAASLQKLCSLKIDFNAFLSLQSSYSDIANCVAAYESDRPVKLGKYCDELSEMLVFHKVVFDQRERLTGLSSVLSMFRHDPPSPNVAIVVVDRLLAAGRRRDELTVLLHRWVEFSDGVTKKANEIKDLTSDMEQKTGGQCPLCGQELAKCNTGKR